MKRWTSPRGPQIGCPITLRAVFAPLRVFALFALFALSSAFVQAASAVMPAVDAKSPLVLPAGVATRPVFLQVFDTRVDPASRIGETQTGDFCARRGDILWSEASARLLTPAPAMTSRFRSELTAAGYPVPAISSSATSETPDATKAERVRVSASISNILVNVCARSLQGTGAWTGDAYLKITWRVLGPESEKPLFEASTEGVYRVPAGGHAVAHPMVITASAFAVAARNLLAEPGLHMALAAPAASASAASTAPVVSAASAPSTLASGASPTPEPASVPPMSAPLAVAK